MRKVEEFFAAFTHDAKTDARLRLHAEILREDFANADQAHCSNRS